MIGSSLGVAQSDDPVRAIQEAATVARRSAGESITRAALVLTAGPDGAAASGTRIRDTFGEIPTVGASVEAILSDAGIVTSGAAVMCFHGDSLVPSVGCGGRAAGLSAATERAGRLILSGARDRRHYPRGLAFAFARPVVAPGDFSLRWRLLVGPKLLTVFGVSAGPALHAPGSEDPGDLVVLCIEGPYQRGLGVDGGLVPGEPPPAAATLVHGAADAAMTAVKRLEGQTPRAALVAESASRHARLGDRAKDEWMAMRDRIGPDVPCLGWLSGVTCGYGRDATAASEAGALVVAVMGAAP